MVDQGFLTYWRRNLSFFAARGTTYAIAYSRWRIKHLLSQKSARSLTVDVDDLLSALDPGAVAFERNRESALQALLVHFQSRSSPVFFFNETDIAGTVERIPAEQKEQTVRAAEQLCQNIFDLRGAGPIKFDGSIDWTFRPGGNIDWHWDMNRHVFFDTLGRAYLYTGDERYAAKFRELLRDWLANNPARMDYPNWNSVFEVAFRSNVWVWALHHFRRASVFDAELCQKLLAGLLMHGRYLNANLELHVPNNHLLLEAKALAFLGILLPEFKEASKWRERGLQLLERQVLEQVCQDGVHAERATLYHRVIAGEVLELLVLMENNRIPAPPGLVERFARMVEFELALVKPDGTFPLLGDSSAKDTHLRFSASSAGPIFLGRSDLASTAPPLQEPDSWLLGLQRISARQERRTRVFKSAAFPAGGYYLMSAGQGTSAFYLVFDCGPFGLEAMPNHGHADALSFELFAFGETLLVDPGYYGTALGLNWRNFFRGTRSHNTVVVDGLDQSKLLDERRIYRPARTTCLSWISNDDFDFVDGVHNGYEKLAQPVTHRRHILFAKPRYWVIVDVLTGLGQHCFDLYFHMMPDARATPDPKSRAIQVGNPSSAGLWILPVGDGEWQQEIVMGATNPIQGWTSFVSGKKEPAPVLRLTMKAQASIQFCTVLYPYPVDQEQSIKVSPLSVEGRSMDDPALTAISIETPARADYLVIDRAAHSGRGAGAHLETGARVEFTSEKRAAGCISVDTEKA